MKFFAASFAAFAVAVRAQTDNENLNCLYERCPTALTNCEADAGCVELIDCTAECPSYDANCALACVAPHMGNPVAIVVGICGGNEGCWTLVPPDADGVSDYPTWDSDENNAKVINGFRTEGKIWRGTVLVQTGSGGGCSGSYIHPKIILTAGHCCSGGQTTMSARAGATGEINLGNSLSYSKAASGTSNDMCVMHMAQTKPSDIPHYDVHISNANTGSDSVIVGYGHNASSIIGGGSGFGVARYGLTRVASYSRNDMLIGARSGASPQQNACNGDSGGPVFVESNGKWMVHGVTSRGAAGCPTSQNVYYTNAASNVNFIRSFASSNGHDLSGTGGNRVGESGLSYEFEA